MKKVNHPHPDIEMIYSFENNVALKCNLSTKQGVCLGSQYLFFITNFYGYKIFDLGNHLERIRTGHQGLRATWLFCINEIGDHFAYFDISEKKNKKLVFGYINSEKKVEEGCFPFPTTTAVLAFNKKNQLMVCFREEKNQKSSIKLVIYEHKNRKKIFSYCCFQGLGQEVSPRRIIQSGHVVLSYKNNTYLWNPIQKEPPKRISSVRNACLVNATFGLSEEATYLVVNHRFLWNRCSYLSGIYHTTHPLPQNLLNGFKEKDKILYIYPNGQKSTFLLVVYQPFDKIALTRFDVKKQKEVGPRRLFYFPLYHFRLDDLSPEWSAYMISGEQKGNQFILLSPKMILKGKYSLKSKSKYTSQKSMTHSWDLEWGACFKTKKIAYHSMNGVTYPCIDWSIYPQKHFLLKLLDMSPHRKIKKEDYLIHMVPVESTQEVDLRLGSLVARKDRIKYPFIRQAYHPYTTFGLIAQELAFKSPEQVDPRKILFWLEVKDEEASCNSNKTSTREKYAALEVNTLAKKTKSTYWDICLEEVVSSFDVHIPFYLFFHLPIPYCSFKKKRLILNRHTHQATKSVPFTIRFPYSIDYSYHFNLKGLALFLSEKSNRKIPMDAFRFVLLLPSDEEQEKRELITEFRLKENQIKHSDIRGFKVYPIPLRHYLVRFDCLAATFNLMSPIKIAFTVAENNHSSKFCEIKI